ncbi:MAG: GNAT family N-acetyltransferase [Acidiferrobacter sp.]
MTRPLPTGSTTPRPAPIRSFSQSLIRQGSATGLAAYLRIDPPHGSLAVGALVCAPARASAGPHEASGVRARLSPRYEGTRHAQSTASRATAKRVGFVCEGIFWQAMVVKDHNRDTACYAGVDCE